MVVRSEGPLHNLGFGHYMRPQEDRFQERETIGPNPESGPVARALHGHPVMTFLATSAATIVSMGLAGQVVKRGGIKLAQHASISEAPFARKFAKGFRETQRIMDDLEGVSRIFADPDDPVKFYAKQTDGSFRGDTANRVRGFYINREEIANARRLGSEQVPIEWGVKDEVRQRLVMQARRLPYELPGAYIAQRGVIDPMMGTNEETNVNWYNPVDVLADFVDQSVKNLATMIGPFEAGMGASVHAYRKAFTYGDGFTKLNKARVANPNAAVTLQASLEQIGHDVSTLTNKIAKFSSQTTGAFATGVEEAAKSRVGIVQFMHQMRKGEWLATIKAQTTATERLLQTADTLPFSLSGAVSGYRAGKVRFNEIGKSHDAFDKLLRLGRTRFDTVASELEKEAVRSFSGGQISPLLSVAEEIAEMGKGSRRLGSSGKNSGKWIKSKFYSDRINDEFQVNLKKKLNHRLRQNGLGASEADNLADDFVRRHSIDPVTGSNTDITHRARIGGKNTNIEADSHADFFSQFVAKTGRYDQTQRGFLERTLSDAIGDTDAMFARKVKTGTPNPSRVNIDRKIQQQWENVYDNDLVSMTDHMVGKRKPDYHSFDMRIGGADHDYLVRRAAKSAGMADHLVDESLSTSKSYLDKIGLKSDSPEVLRGFLVSKKEINKPWQRGGFNIFGFRQVSTDTLFERNLGSESAEARKALGHITRSSDDRITTTVPGLFETKSGHVININKMRRGARRAADVAANEYHIPIVKFNPLQLMGYGRNESLVERSILSYVPGMSNQPFVNGAENVDFMMAMRRHGRSSKAEVRAFSGTNPSNILGIFQPTVAQSVGLAGRHARIAAGDMGYGPIEGTPQQQGRIASMFLRNNAEYQQGSAGNLWRRFKGRRRDVNNPVTMAKLIRGDTIGDRQGNYRLTAGQVVDDSGSVIASREQVADSLETFHRFVNRNVFPKALYERTSVIGAARDALDRIQHSSSYKFSSGETKRLADARTTQDKVLFARNVLKDEDQVIKGLEAQGREEAARNLARARETLVDHHIRDSSSAGYWDKPTGSAKRSAGVSRRIDEMVSDLQSYLDIKEGIVSERYDTFSGRFSVFINDIDQLKKSGVLSHKEAVEAKAAMLSTQIHYSKIKNFSSEAPTVAQAIKVLDELGNPSSLPVRNSLAEIASGMVGSTSSNNRIGIEASRLGKQIFGIADESYEGFSYNPFGNTNTVLTPTFGQAVKQTGFARAAGSALGFGTYRNPQAFSPAANISSHLVDRLNRYINVFGAGVDPTAFNGPIDMFARGMVGQRVFPLFAAGTLAVGADATLGGLVGEKDSRGDRIYSPLVLGAMARPLAESQAITAGLIPGGLSYEESREQIFEGEVAIRRNRFWPLNRTPFRGEGVEYFRPSWYRRMQAGTQYSESGWDSPAERALFGYDFSPLRPIDPYRFEKKHLTDRPYPVTGDYFTGPFGPVTPFLNSTIGRVLKPSRLMHEDEVAVANTYGYSGVGESGAFSMLPYVDARRSVNAVGASIGGNIAGEAQAGYIAGSGTPAYTASALVQRDIEMANTMLVAQAYESSQLPNSASSAYGIPNLPGVMPPNIIPARAPVLESGFQLRAADTAYKTQEALGIYGFGFGAVRSALGFGDQDYTPNSPVLQSADAAYGATRAFWDLNLGGLGDAPSETMNLNVSEIVRRFIPKQRSGINYLNPIRNELGVEHPWLPGANHYLDFTRGDPFTKITEGEVRLPGQVYERLNTLHSDETGKYGLIDRHKILGQVAPYSQEYKRLDRIIDSNDSSSSELLRIATTREQVKRVTQRNEFHEYTALYDPNSTIQDKLIERALHADNILTRKLNRHSSAVEDWERKNVYGPTFQQWQTPGSSFIEPMIYENTQRSPFEGAGRLGFGFQFFGKTPQARLVAGSVGAATGFASGAYGASYEKITGRRFIPKERKEQAQLEEYTDILTYVKNTHLANRAKQAGNATSAYQFERAAKRTMFGLDLENASVDDILAAVPKRKREHFEAFLSAPDIEKEQILSTAPRLERRILQAAWGRSVESLPDLESFFSNRELPSETWEGFHPNTNMDHIKIKVGQHKGLDLSQMGYYPQQIQQANLVNPSFPVIGFQTDSRSIRLQLESLLRGTGISGTVTESPNPFGGVSLQMNQGVLV
jgi:hypothetical protein